jgi:hypothetical protein
MKRSTRWIGLVWLAVVLNVLSPVIGYARDAAAARDPLSIELCSAAGAKRIVIAAGTSGDTSKTHPVVPHCVYCPGFAANFALGASAPPLYTPARTPGFAQPLEPVAIFVRRSVRAAQPRAPPETLI